MDKKILKVTVVGLLIVLLIQMTPYSMISDLTPAYSVKQENDLGVVQTVLQQDVKDVSEKINTPVVPMQPEAHVSIAEVDIYNLLPIGTITSNEVSTLNSYINDMLSSDGYVGCVLVEYVRDEENDSNCYHFVWDNERYTCIYITAGHDVPLLLYDVELTDDMMQYWDII